MKIGFLWASSTRGFYATASFQSLYSMIGHNNGNLAFVYALENHFVGKYVHLPWHARPEVVNKRCDIVVIPCANQLGKHTDLGALSDNLKKYEVPIVAIGLGAQSNDFDEDIMLSAGTEKWLHVLLNNGQKHGIDNIYTRGEYTSSQIFKLTGRQSVPGGCPSHFISRRPDLGDAIFSDWNSRPFPRSIAVAGGHQAWAKVRNVEHQLISLISDPLYPGCYIPQSMSDMIKISRGLFDDIDPSTLDRIRAHTVPHYTREEFIIWAKMYAKTYYEVPAWADDLKRYDLTIGPRYHGCAIALQAEKMACTIAIDTRTEELCMETGVPCVRHDALNGFAVTRRALKDSLIKFDPRKYDIHRAQKCKLYVDFCQRAGLSVQPYLVEIASRASES